MTFIDTNLPWTGAQVRRTENLHATLERHFPESWGKYLPASITLYVDPAVSDAKANEFVEAMGEQLQLELKRRVLRRKKFVDLGLFSEGELDAFLTRRTNVQAWALYFSEEGGLWDSRSGASQLPTGDHGVIPCSSMQNHGVAWKQNADGTTSTWLATSRRAGADWDWDSDIGHESAHAAFAQVPLFVQSSPRLPNDLLAASENGEAIGAEQIAQIMYLYSEIAVVAVRGEPRATETGLPVALHAELEALLRVSAALAKDPALEEAARISAKVSGRFDVNNGEELFQVAAPIIRRIPFLTQFVNNPVPPSPSQFEAAMRLR